MSIKRIKEKDLLEGLDANADELAEPFPHELEPLERLRGAVKRYDHPTDPIWDEYAGSDGGFVDDFMDDRDQLSPAPDKE